MTAHIAPSANPLVRPKRASGPPSRPDEPKHRFGRAVARRRIPEGEGGAAWTGSRQAGRGRPGCTPASSTAEAGRPDRPRERPRRKRGSERESRVTPSGRWYEAAVPRFQSHSGTSGKCMYLLNYKNGPNDCPALCDTASGARGCHPSGSGQQVQPAIRSRLGPPDRRAIRSARSGARHIKSG